MFSSEEPTRFGISCLRSRLLAGIVQLAELKSTKDSHNVSFSDASKFAGYTNAKGDLSEVSLKKGTYSAFVKLHIEQGPILEKGVSIGVVTAIAAPASIKVTFEGNEGHAGAALMPKRNDAGLATAKLALAMEKHVLNSGSVDTVGTVGMTIAIAMLLESIVAKVSAPGNSPNTDGIHVKLSTGVSITNSHIGTGDDCISIDPGNSNLWIEGIACDPGHGISIGSLGWKLEELGVQNVTVKIVTFTGTTNGVRVKTWARSSNGFVRGVLFQHIVMVNVKNPIIIDQNYCPNHESCPKQGSAIKISDITYQDIRGTSSTEVAVKLDCNKINPCSGITLEDVNLSYKDQPTEAACVNARGRASGLKALANCL
ncbi:hypothetical protein CQW23_03708 [Capsicum baccatum]|uniref:Polygalacturonase n=1 Tax=Capsicum baccatum TaxID=33114 RepID=A0A2G2XCI8_CAPBA|nr:hypothetical protein CQW23_03708 [Capsicum baccatum]